MSEAITVTRFNTYIKQIFDAEELLHNISIVGEVFGVSLSRNVLYFSLKDENASLPCVCFYPNFASEMIEGDKIIVTGSPNFYVKGGKINFNVVKVEKVGQGKLYEEFLKMKEKLEREGLFDPSHKKELPKEIKRIGVITSREGAVIQDIKNVSWRRNPSVDIVLYNTKVQGNNAENEIAHAIEVMGNYDKVDVIIVARGGGSLEDLWAYNSEIVARATYNCSKPIVSAVGHETDWTIIDFVSDLRAPTPSAAAEIVNFNAVDRRKELTTKASLLLRQSQNYLDKMSALIQNSCFRLVGSYDKIIIAQNGKLEKIKQSLPRVLTSFLNQKYYELGLIENSLAKANPNEILSKGYARIEQNDKTLTKSKDINYSDKLKIIFKDGTAYAQPLKEKKDEN